MSLRITKPRDVVTDPLARGDPGVAFFGGKRFMDDEDPCSVEFFEPHGGFLRRIRGWRRARRSDKLISRIRAEQVGFSTRPKV
jgi:hypothetical protein